MPTLDQIEQINKKLIEFGKEKEILNENGEEVRIIQPPEQNLDDDLSQLISTVDEDTDEQHLSIDEIIEKGEHQPLPVETPIEAPPIPETAAPKEKTLEEEMLEQLGDFDHSTVLSEESSDPTNQESWDHFSNDSFSLEETPPETPPEEAPPSTESDFDFSDFESGNLDEEHPPLSEEDSPTEETIDSFDFADLAEIKENFTLSEKEAPELPLESDSSEEFPTEPIETLEAFDLDASPLEEPAALEEPPKALDDFDLGANELDDIESFLSGEKDSLDISGDFDLDSDIDMDFNTDFDENAFSSESGDFTTDFADFSQPSENREKAQEEDDDFFHDLMSEANKNAAEEAIGNGEEFFALDEFSEKEEEPASSMEESPAEAAEEDEDSPFGEYMESSIDEFELEDSIEGSSPKKKDLSQTIFSLSGNTEEKKEFYLSENQIFEIKKNLTYLPRNLKIAVEEFIANEETKEPVVQELTNLILANSSAKKIAAILERETGETIKLPARYRAMSGYELEKQQNSFMYKFLTRYLPAFLVGLCITAGVTFLFWILFAIITPWSSASSKYREGRKAIVKGNYEKAESCFKLAYFGNEKKSWPYKGFPNRTETLKYADLYEFKRQYNYAEDKYQLLLRNHWEKSSHLKKSKLKYARMLSQSLGRHAEAVVQLKEIKEGGIIEPSGIRFQGIGNDADADFALARVYFLWGDDDNRYDYYDEAMNQLSSYLVAPGKKVFNEVLSYELWYLSKRNETNKMAKIIKENYFANKKEEKRFKKIKKDLRIWNDIVDCFLSARFTQEPVSVLMNSLEKDYPTDPELNWHRSRQQGLSARPDLEERTLIRVLNLLKITPYQTRREYRIQILATARIGEINYDSKKIIEAKTRLVNAIQTYESLRSRGVLEPKAEYGKIYADLGNLYYYHAGNLDAAYMQFAQAEAQNFKSHVMDYKQGFIDYWRGDFKKAKQQFYFVLEMIPNNKNAIFAMANTMLEDFNLSHAQSHFVRYIKMQNEILPGFGSALNAHRKDQFSILQSLEAAHNNLGVTYYRQYERNSEVEKRDMAMLQFTRSLEYFNVLGRKDKIRVGATVEGLKKYSIPSLNSVASLNQHEIWYREPTPSLSIMRQIPFDLETLEMVEIMESNSVLVTNRLEEILEPLQTAEEAEKTAEFSIPETKTPPIGTRENTPFSTTAAPLLEEKISKDAPLESEIAQPENADPLLTPEEAGAYLIQ